MKLIRSFCAFAALLPSIVMADDTLGVSPEIESLRNEFPLLASLLTADKPWEQEPAVLAAALFDRPARIAQGSGDYPLLFQDQREKDGWPGEKVFGQHAYESEYYTFDRMNPVVKLHVGRPLLHSQQHGRVEEVARSRQGEGQFPFLDPDEIPPLLVNLDAIADRLSPFGAVREESGFYLASRYRLPNGIVMTVINLTGSTNGTPYVEIVLTPEGPVQKFEDTQTLAFPGAEGFGRFAVGGRGGRVFVVTSLEDYLPDGRRGRLEGRYGQASSYAVTLGAGNWIPYVDALGNDHPGVGRPLLPGFPELPPESVIKGTLREAIEAEGPRYVVFAVSGDIELKSDLVITNPYITVAGQTAPGKGVQIRNWGLRVNTHDVILRHLRIRVGEVKGPGGLRRVLGEQTHALDLNAMNIIADHCDIAYANDQIFNTYGSRKRQATTLQWSYVYGGPTRSTHEKGGHSMSVASNGWGYVSLHHNLMAHSLVRNPRADMLTYDFRNNVIYNFRGTGYGSPNDYLRLNYIGNTLKKGPDSTDDARFAFYSLGIQNRFGQWYGEGNWLPDDFEGLFDCEELMKVGRPHPVAPVTTHTAEEAFRLVVSEGGASKPVRDTITTYVAQTVLDGTGFVPGTPDDWPQGGFAAYQPETVSADENSNGIPNPWAVERGLNPATLDATGRDLDPRYDNIEVYLNSL